MPEIHDDILVVLDAVTIESAERYTVLGEPRDLPQTPDGPSVLPAMLETDLYARLYMRPGPRSAIAPDPLAQRDFVAALSTANCGRGTWEPHWKIGEVDEDGRVAVTKDSLTFWVQPDGLRPRDGGIAAGESCRVRVGKELRNLMPGFYVAIGDPDEDDRRDDEAPLIRLYWHLTPASAAPYMSAVTTFLNSAGVPFRTKVLNDPAAFQRADAGVLYFSRRQYDRIRPAVARVLEVVGADLRPEVPMFTRRLAPGLGLAEDPGSGLSFGQHRCQAIARALWQSFERGESTRQEREQSVASAFREAGLDPQRPYLEPGSQDVYAVEDDRAGGASARRRRERPSRRADLARPRKVLLP